MAERKRIKAKLGQLDRGLLVSWMIIVAFGMMMIASAGSIEAHNDFVTADGRPDNFWYLKRQAIWVVLSAIALAFFSRLDYRKLRHFAFPALLIVILLLASVFVPIVSGGMINGAYRWLNFGFIGLQPSEVAKLALAIYLATWLERKGKEVSDFKYGFLPFAAILGVIVFLLFMQKDLGTTVIISFMALTVFFVSGANILQLIGASLSGGLVSAAFIAATPFRRHRIEAWLNPAADAEGIGWHLTQARLTIGSGGLLGLGYGKSLQKYQFLPAAPTDSIFAIISEELGLVGSLAVVALFVYILYRIYRIALMAPDSFGKLLAVGIGAWIGIQAFINIGGLIRVIPMTGVPLPFISYGGSSMLMLSAGIGILLSVSRSMRENQSDAPPSHGRGNRRTRHAPARAR